MHLRIPDLMAESLTRTSRSLQFLHGFSWLKPVLLALVVVVLACDARSPSSPAPREAKGETKKGNTNKNVEQQISGNRHETLTLRGRVVWLADVLKRRHEVGMVREAAQRVLALESKDGTIHPLVEDVAGRAFRRDKRLRETDLELLVRRHRGSPMVQVIRIFQLAKQGKFELDYWCEICAIAMPELKECDCCQGPVELRRRAVNLAPGRSERP